MQADEIKTRLAGQRAEILKTFHVKKIGIFGSFVRERQTRRCDVDILGEFEKGHKDFFNYIRLNRSSYLGKQITY